MTWLAKAEVSSVEEICCYSFMYHPPPPPHPLQHQCNRTLNALMIEAIQRPPRYVLLLQDLLSSTQRDHPDYLNLEAAVQVVSEVRGGASCGRFVGGAVTLVPALTLPGHPRVQPEDQENAGRVGLAHDRQTVSL